MNNELKKTLKEAAWVQFVVPSQNMPAETEADHRKPQKEQGMSRSRSEPVASQNRRLSSQLPWSLMRVLCHKIWFYSAVEVRVRVTLQLTVSQSVCLGVEPRLGHMTRYLFIFVKVSCLVSMEFPLWREFGSVVCRSQSLVTSQLSVYTWYNIFKTTYQKSMYNMYKASVSPGSVQQFMPCFY
jgi:hypothetical protein